MSEGPPVPAGEVTRLLRAWGEGDRGKQEREASSAVALALALGIPMTILGVLLLPAMADLFRVPDSPVPRFRQGACTWAGRG